MGDEMIEKLERQIGVQIENLSVMEDGSEEKAKALDELKKMQDMLLAARKFQEESSGRVKEDEARASERKDRKRDSVLGHAIQIAGIALNAAITVVFMNKGFKFEETGVFTSPTFKNLAGTIFKGFRR